MSMGWGGVVLWENMQFQHVVFFFCWTFSRLELHTESSNAKPELIFMDQIEEVPAEFTQFKNEQCIQIKFRENHRTGNSIILTNPVCIRREEEKKTLIQNGFDVSKLDNIRLYEASHIYIRRYNYIHTQ